ncbi:MAG TPA: PEGA domain-containing protein [Blastocatellia bacterium]|nr:PEGA domain-containing protein [Blastocatellia bacterium]
MKGQRVIREAALVSILVLAFALPSVVSAQVLPTSLGEVKEAKRTAKTITRAPTGSNATSQSNNGVIFVLTDPPNAEIAINGNRVANAINGEFRRELRAGISYAITVSAGSAYEPITRTVIPRRGASEVVRVALVSKYGLVRIGPVLDGAKVFIDGKQVPPDKIELEKESNTVKLDNLVPGEHKISYQHPDYVPLERVFEISPSSEYIWTFNPEPATVELMVQTDPETTVYVDGEPKGTTTKDGSLKRTDIRLGTHVIKLVKDDFEEYSEKKEFKYREPVRIEKRLVPIPTSAEFSDDFDVPNPDLWTMPPSGVKFVGGRLQFENATALCMPTKIRYRDFEMHFHLKLESAAGAAWALRIRDSNNFYLFYLSGPEGRFPSGRFCIYIVRNNQFDPAKPFQSSPIIVKLVRGGQYDINITAKGNIIDHQITSAETGKSENLGFFEDPNNTFLLGGIGFRTVDREKFSIDDLWVRPR